MPSRDNREVNWSCSLKIRKLQLRISHQQTLPKTPIGEWSEAFHPQDKSNFYDTTVLATVCIPAREKKIFLGVLECKKLRLQ